MQIASQPTEAAAQSSYQDLARRYGKVLGGKQATIVKAEIAGKGTFWRVRGRPPITTRSALRELQVRRRHLLRLEVGFRPPTGQNRSQKTGATASHRFFRSSCRRYEVEI